MELVGLASAIALLLATKGGEGFATATGSHAWAGFARLIGLVRARFADDHEAENALVLAQESPTDVTRLQALATAISAHAEQHAEFRDQLVALLMQAQDDPVVGRVAIQVTQGGYIGKVTTFNAPIRGDVTF